MLPLSSRGHAPAIPKVAQGAYVPWANGTQGGEGEALLGRWRRSRGISSEIVIATKLGGRPLTPSSSFSKNIEGLSAEVIRTSAAASRERPGVEKLDLLYAHVEDDRVPLSETVTAFAELVSEGSVGLLGVSNHWAWRVERARALAAAAGLPGYEVLQYHHSYLRQRTDMPTLRSADGSIGVAGGDLLSYLRADPGLALVAYSPLLGGGYSQPVRPVAPGFDHGGTATRWEALGKVAKETGATANQVVLAWLIGGEVPVIPLVGASSVAQLAESLAAVDLELTADQRARLDRAN